MDIRYLYDPKLMETIRGLELAEFPRVDPSPVAAGFLHTIRHEQEQFLETLRRAQSILRHEPGELAQLAAIHLRLTQQFLDGQRAILARRAAVDAEVASIVEACETAPHVESQQDVGCGASSPTSHEIAKLGTTVLRTAAEVDALRSVIDDAFRRFDLDSAGPQRQLCNLLDEWWSAEAGQRAAAVDDARARALVRRHMAAVETCHVIEDTLRVTSPGDDRRFEPATALPEHVLAVLDAADAGALDRLFSGLIETLGGPSDAVQPIGVVSSGAPSVSVPLAVLAATPRDTSTEAETFWPPTRFRVRPKGDLGTIRLGISLWSFGVVAVVAVLVSAWSA